MIFQRWKEHRKFDLKFFLCMQNHRFGVFKARAASQKRIMSERAVLANTNLSTRHLVSYWILVLKCLHNPSSLQTSGREQMETYCPSSCEVTHLCKECWQMKRAYLFRLSGYHISHRSQGRKKHCKRVN